MARQTDITILKQLVLGSIYEMGIKVLTAKEKMRICDYSGLKPYEVKQALDACTNEEICSAVYGATK